MATPAISRARRRARRVFPPSFDRRRRDGGVTLIELLIVVSIIAILAAGAVPGFGRAQSVHRASSAIADLQHAIALTRSEALKRGRRVYLAPLGLHWRDGWVIFVDRNDNRVYDPPSASGGDELIARHDALPASIVVSNPTSPLREPFTDVGAPQRTYLMFDGSGHPRQRNGAFNIGSLVVTDRSGGAVTVRTLCVSSYGRVRVVADRPSC